jgi:hypothetical protein
MRQAIADEAGTDTVRKQLDAALLRHIPVGERMPLRTGTIPELGQKRRRYLLDGTVVFEDHPGDEE